MEDWKIFGFKVWFTPRSPNQYIDPLDLWVPTDGVFIARPLQRFDPGGEGTKGNLALEPRQNLGF
jgi:hypothetical protein